MKCPFCDYEELKVTDSRNSPENNSIRRRRECLGCGKRFTTFEMVEMTDPRFNVSKRDGRVEPFQQHKIIKGLKAACRHTRIDREGIIQLASHITEELANRQLQEVSSGEIGEKVMEELAKLDRLAYIRYACVYRRFKNISELRHAIELMD